jgi:L-rhamnose isomerase
MRAIFTPTESIADKVSSVLPWVPGILLHVSRGVRWDSDHVVVLTDDLKWIAEECVRAGEDSRIRVGLDYFDASINRVAAWVIGTRCLLKAWLLAWLQPMGQLQAAEEANDLTARLAWQEESKTLPFGSVWDFYCLRSEVPIAGGWLNELRSYERDVQLKRDTR